MGEGLDQEVAVELDPPGAAVRALHLEAARGVVRPREQGERIALQQESMGGRTWSTMTPGGLPLRITWTYDRGYMVAASDRASASMRRTCCCRTSGL